MSELRHRHVTNPLDSFRELDAFKMNKLPEEIEQKSTIGKTTSVIISIMFKIKLFRRWNDVNFITHFNSPRNL